MTRATVAVTTYRLRLTCDKCGLALYTWRAGGRGWVTVDGRDYCPGCKEAVKVERVDGNGR